MKRLLERCEIARGSVRPWFRPATSAAVEARGLARQRVVNEALRPAEATDDWRGAIRDIRAAAVARGEARDPIAEGLQGLSLLTVRAEEEAAAAIALMMRETLETPNPDGTGRTCALVTPDQALGRRVAARLERWGVIPDSSAGSPLSRLPAGALVDLCARWIADPVQPHLLLAVVKHPLVRFDLGDASQAAAVAALEEHALRGPRPRDFSALHRRLLEAVQPDRARQGPARVETGPAVGRHPTGRSSASRHRGRDRRLYARRRPEAHGRPEPRRLGPDPADRDPGGPERLGPVRTERPPPACCPA
nr:hypothetical protein [uncultured Brevundimonas sp.]